MNETHKSTVAADFEVRLEYRPEDWAVAADGGRAPRPGAFVAELLSSGCYALGATPEQALAGLASELGAWGEADGYPPAAIVGSDSGLAAHVLRSALRGTLEAEISAAAPEPVLAD